MKMCPVDILAEIKLDLLRQSLGCHSGFVGSEVASDASVATADYSAMLTDGVSWYFMRLSAQKMACASLIMIIIHCLQCLKCSFFTLSSDKPKIARNQ